VRRVRKQPLGIYDVRGPIRFSPDGKQLFTVRAGVADNLWAQWLDGSPRKQITDFPAERIIDFHWSFGRKQLGLIRSRVDSDVVLIGDMKKIARQPDHRERTSVCGFAKKVGGASLGVNWLPEGNRIRSSGSELCLKRIGGLCRSR
jgi:hypothetical protein